tara:strand:+ start:341 stop:592 length:252 start_codon:yes stop_codon:yes gene_type:complete
MNCQSFKGFKDISVVFQNPFLVELTLLDFLEDFALTTFGLRIRTIDIATRVNNIMTIQLIPAIKGKPFRLINSFCKAEFIISK